MDFSIDTSELRTLAADLTDAPREVQRQVPAVVKRGAVNIKNDMRDALADSTYFKGAAPAVTFDELEGGMAAEIGPTKGKPGGIAVIGYFGGSYGGGGTVEDPQKALDREAPKFIDALGDLFDGIL